MSRSDINTSMAQAMNANQQPLSTTNMVVRKNDNINSAHCTTLNGNNAQQAESSAITQQSSINYQQSIPQSDISLSSNQQQLRAGSNINTNATQCANQAESQPIMSSNMTAASFEQRAPVQLTLRCYLCEIPKQEYSLIHSFSKVVCRGCVNYEGPDRVEQLIESARKFKSAATTSFAPFDCQPQPLNSLCPSINRPQIRMAPANTTRLNGSQMKGRQQQTRLKQQTQLRQPVQQNLSPTMQQSLQMCNDMCIPSQDNPNQYEQVSGKTQANQASSSPKPKRRAINQQTKNSSAPIPASPVYSSQVQETNKQSDSTNQQKQQKVPYYTSPYQMTTPLVASTQVNNDKILNKNSLDSRDCPPIAPVLTPPSQAKKVGSLSSPASVELPYNYAPTKNTIQPPPMRMPVILQQQLTSYPHDGGMSMPMISSLQQQYSCNVTGNPEGCTSTAISTNSSVNNRIVPTQYEQLLGNRAKTLNQGQHTSSSIMPTHKPRTFSAAHDIRVSDNIDETRLSPHCSDPMPNSSSNIYTAASIPFSVANSYLSLDSQLQPTPYQCGLLSNLPQHHSHHQQQALSILQQPTNYNTLLSNAGSIPNPLVANNDDLSRQRMLEENLVAAASAHQYYAEKYHQQQVANDNNLRRLLMDAELSNKQINCSSIRSTNSASIQPQIRRPILSPISPPISLDTQQNVTSSASFPTLSSPTSSHQQLLLQQQHQKNMEKLLAQDNNNNFISDVDLPSMQVNKNVQHQQQSFLRQHFPLMTSYLKSKCPSSATTDTACCNIYAQDSVEQSSIDDSGSPDEVELLDEIRPPTCESVQPVQKEPTIGRSESMTQKDTECNQHIKDSSCQFANNICQPASQLQEQLNSTNDNWINQLTTTNQEANLKEQTQIPVLTPQTDKNNELNRQSTPQNANPQTNRSDASVNSNTSQSETTTAQPTAVADKMNDESDKDSSKNNQHKTANSFVNSLKCLICNVLMGDKHFVQCPRVVSHKFCFNCSRKSIEQQRAAFGNVDENEKSKFTSHKTKLYTIDKCNGISLPFKSFDT